MDDAMTQKLLEHWRKYAEFFLAQPNVGVSREGDMLTFTCKANATEYLELAKLHQDALDGRGNLNTNPLIELDGNELRYVVSGADPQEALQYMAQNVRMRHDQKFLTRSGNLAKLAFSEGANPEQVEAVMLRLAEVAPVMENARWGAQKQIVAQEFLRSDAQHSLCQSLLTAMEVAHQNGVYSSAIADTLNIAAAKIPEYRAAAAAPKDVGWAKRAVKDLGKDGQGGGHEGP